MKEHKFNIFELLKWLLALVLSIGVGILGGICHGEGYFNEDLLSVVMLVLVGVLSIGTLVGWIMKKRFIDTIDRENLQNNLLEQRARANEIAGEKLRLLKRLIRTIDLISVGVLVSVCIIIFNFFVIVGGEGSGAVLPMIIGIYAGLYFIRPRKIKINEKKREDYLPEGDYPLIYGTARRAADIVGCDGKIKIFVNHDFNASVFTIAGGYSIMLGSYLIDNLSQDELFHVLLHEFAHVEKKNDEINNVLNYASLSMENGGTEISVIPYIYFHAKFAFEFISYQYVCSLMHEDAADAAMREHGDPKIATSMLIKLKFAEMFQWEQNTYDEESLYAFEKIIDDPIRRPLVWFKDRMELRKDLWIGLIDKEILARNASHSTINMRIKALGVNELKLIPKCDSEEYLAEVNRVFLHMEKLIKKELEPSYNMLREQHYLRHLKVIEQWEKDGKPLTKENYQEIILAHFGLFRITDFVNLCCHIIEKIPEPANYFAHHMYGIYLLRCYDERGIDHLYKAIELNHNIWEEALNTIGEYACIVGKQDELDKYRERAIEITKKELNVYEKMNSLTVKDKVVEEKLPEHMMDDMLAYFGGIDNGTIDKIYMVRKPIDEEHFVTCIVVAPKKKAEPQKFADTMEKIYQHLDKSSDWQFSLFDMRVVPHGKIVKVKNSCIYTGR